MSGSIVQWLERPAHNGDVIGSNPIGPKILQKGSYNMTEHKYFFNKLLQENSISLNEKKGHLVTGIIVNISKDIVFVDIGSKKHIRFKRSELYPTAINPMISLTVGEKIPLYVDHYDYFDNNIVLSYEKGQRLLRERTIWEYVEQRKFLTGRILNHVNGGYSVGIGGLVAFLPKNHLGQLQEKSMGQLLNFSILKVNRSNNNVIVSRSQAYDSQKRKRSIVR